MVARFLPAFLQVSVQVLAAVGLAMVFAAMWSTAGATSFTPALSTILFIAAGLWLLGAGSLAPRVNKLGYMRWAVAVSCEELQDDAGRRPRARPVVLPPIAATLLVAAILIVLGILLA